MKELYLEYGRPLTMEEIEKLRCLIGHHFFKDCGAPRRRCVLCGEDEDA
jgi:hypothetical protein